MASELTRRNVLIACGTVALGTALSPVRVTANAGSALKLYGWDDALQRTQIEGASASPTGDYVVVEVTRPLGAGGRYGGWARPAIRPRASLLLFRQGQHDPTHLTNDDHWTWAPDFSPQETWLVSLASLGDGRAGFAVWDLRTDQRRLFLNADVEIYAHVSTNNIAQARPAGVLELPRQFGWLDENTILFVQAGEDRGLFDQAIGSEELIYSQLHRSAHLGDLAVRVWNQDSPTCGIGRQLAKLDIRTGEVSRLYGGDIRGASVSPDGRWIAAICATGHLRIAPDKPMEFPIPATASANDPLVKLTLVLIDSRGELPPRVIREFDAVGNVAPSRLPIWSDNSRHLAVPIRSAWSSSLSSGADAALMVSVEPLATRRWLARSALDAELIAALGVALPESGVDAAIAVRPRVSESTRPERIGQIPGAVWKVSERVVLWNDDELSVIDASGIESIAKDCTVVNAPVPWCDGSASIYMEHKTGERSLITLDGSSWKAARLRIPKECAFLGVANRGKAVLTKWDAPHSTQCPW
jgi:hypothetical protein